MVGRSEPWTKAEKARVELLKPRGCVRCWLTKGVQMAVEQIHHMLIGNRRMGHWYTLPLCTPCHVDAHNSTYKHAEQIRHWRILQQVLGLNDELPKSKIFARGAA